MMKARLIVLALLGVFSSMPASADVVTLSDGSRLLGTVERMGDGKLILVTKFAGTLEIDATMVTSISTDETVNVGMDTGDRLVGPLEWKAEIERVVVDTEWGGVPVNVDRIDAIWPTDGKSPEVLAMEEQIKAVEAEAEALRAKWVLTAEVGILFQEGNTEVFNVHGRIDLSRTTPKDLLKFYLAANYREEHDERNAHEITGGAYYEYMLTKHWYAYARSDLEYDEFENLDLRLSTVAGPGYYWIKKPEHELKTFAGVGYLHETYQDGTTRDAAQAELGVGYRVDIVPWMQFTHATSYYPTFETLRDYRIVSDTGLVFPLGESDMWKLKLGAQYEYKSLPNRGRERLDQTYYTSLIAEVK